MASGDNPEDELKTKVVVPLDEDDIALLKTYVCLFFSIQTCSFRFVCLIAPVCRTVRRGTIGT
jgi:hypothetical protein